jgi:hypothetical protein
LEEELGPAGGYPQCRPLLGRRRGRHEYF